MTLTDIISGINGTVLLGIANVVFIIIAIFLFMRLRKLRKECEPEKKQQESAGTMDITPAEPKPESSGMKPQDITPPEKPMASAPDIGAEITQLKLEDELPEIKEMPVKRESKKKQAAKKIPEEQAIKKEAGAPSEKIPTPETEEVKLEKKEVKRKKPSKKRPSGKTRKEAAKEKS